LIGGTFAVGDTITGGSTGATAVIVTDDGATSMTAYMTSPGVAFDGSEVLDNGNGVTADMDGAATSPTIVQGDVVIWNLSHYQLTDATLLDGTDPATNTAAYTELTKATANVGYITAWDVSEFDFPNNWIQYREDLSGNKLYYSKNNDLNNLGLGSTAISLFQWGRTTWTGNISEEGVFNEQNFLGTIANITLGFNAIIQNNTCANTTPVIESSSLGSFCEITGNIFGNNSYLFNCILEKSSLITNNQILSGTNIAQTQFFVAVLENCIFNNCVFRYNALGANAIISEINAASGTDIENNILENGAQIIGITAGANCSIGRNKIGQGATLGGGTTMGDYAEFENNFISNNGQISGITIGQDGQIKNNYVYSASILDITAGTDFIMSNNILESGASITNISALDEVSVSYNKLSANSSIGYLPLLADTARIQFLSLASDSRINNKSFDTGVAITNKIIQFISDDTETYTSNIEGYRSQPGFSDIPGTIDITGLTTLDCTAAWAQYRGIYNIASGNATEAIDTITNPPMLFPFTIRPEAGLVLTITGTAYAGIGAGQIALKAASYTLDGDKGEYIVLEIDPLGTGALIEKQVVNGLI
jgi:hypothetical protein